MPINASDDYVRGFAAYVQAHLRPDLKIHVEYSNEVWNWAFPQAHYALARAQETSGPNDNWMEWYGRRTAQIGKIWNEAFGEPATGTAIPGRVSSSTTHKPLGKDWSSTDSRPTLAGPSGNHIRAADYFESTPSPAIIMALFSGHGDAGVATVQELVEQPDGGYEALPSLT